MIQLVAFDWNGTLLSDTRITWKAENLALKTVGFKGVSLLKFRQSFDMPIKKLWQNLGVDWQTIEEKYLTIEKNFYKNYEVGENRARSRAGSRELLIWLQKEKIYSVICSNHPTLHIEKQLKRLKFEGMIEKVLGRKVDDVTHLHSRNKTYRLQDYIKAKKFKPKEIVYIGDTEEEVELGRQNGYVSVGITGGYNTESRLKKHKPDFLIHNMKELIGIIKRLNK